MPTFNDCSVHTARITFYNPKDVPLTYKAQVTLEDPDNLWTVVAQSEEPSITIPAGSSVNQDFTIRTPTLPPNSVDNFRACCNVRTAEGVDIQKFVDGSIVEVVWVQGVYIGDIVWAS